MTLFIYILFIQSVFIWNKIIQNMNMLGLSSYSKKICYLMIFTFDMTNKTQCPFSFLLVYYETQYPFSFLLVYYVPPPPPPYSIRYYSVPVFAFVLCYHNDIV